MLPDEVSTSMFTASGPPSSSSLSLPRTNAGKSLWRPPELTSSEPDILVFCGNHKVTLPDEALARTVV